MPHKDPAVRRAYANEYYRRQRQTEAGKKVNRIYTKRWKDKNPDAVKRLDARGRLRYRYGLSVADLERLLAEQGGVCAICGAPPNDRPLDIDHDHRCCPGVRTCGRCIRGLLCRRCNLMVGFMESDAAPRAAAYLASFER